MKTLTRRTLLAAPLAASLAAPGLLRSARAQAPTKIRIMLAWLPDASYAYPFIARHQGYFRKRGIEVEIARGYGSLAAAQAVAAGQFEIGFANPASVVLLGSKGVDLMQIGLMDYDPFMCVAMRADAGITTPPQLEGRRVATTNSSSDAAFFPVFCQRNNVDISKVDRINMDAKLRNQAVVTKQVDGATGLASSLMTTMGTAGVKARYFLYSAYNTALYGNIGITVQPAFVEQHPQLCQDIMDALSEGLRDQVADWRAAAEVFLAEVPEQRMMSNAQESVRIAMGVQRAGVIAGTDAQDHGIGWADPAKLREMAALVMQYQAEPGAKMPDLDRMFTNRFAGRVTLDPAQWKKVAQDTQDIAAEMRG